MATDEEREAGRRARVPGSRAGQILERCRELATGHLEGTESPADDLVETAEGDRRGMEIARRQVLADLDREPGDRVAKQMLSLLRRALERGVWDWDE